MISLSFPIEEARGPACFFWDSDKVWLERDYANSQGETNADIQEKVTCYTTQQVESWSLHVLIQKPYFKCLMAPGERKHSGNSRSTYLTLIHTLKSKQMQSWWFGLYLKNMICIEKWDSWAISNNKELMFVWQKPSQDPSGTETSLGYLVPRGQTSPRQADNREVVPQTAQKLLLAYKR